VVVAYEAPAACPTRARFVAHLRSYLDEADVPAAKPSFSVVISTGSEGSAFRGRLVMRGADGEPAERTLDATSCEEVTLALAYVAALAISPNARAGLGPAPPPLSVPEATSATSATSASPASPAAASAAVPVAASSSAPTVPSSPDPSAARAGSSNDPATGSSAPRFAVHVSAFGQSGLAPTLAPGLAVGAEARVATVRFGLEFLGSRRTFSPAEAGSVRFRLLATRLVVCPFTDSWVTRWEASLCAAFTAGQLQATSAGLDRTGSSAEPWLVPALRLRGTAWLGDDRWLGLRLALDGGAPLVRPSYRFDEPAITVHRVPVLVAEAAASLVVRF
jgi:hypothetical protein